MQRAKHYSIPILILSCICFISFTQRQYVVRKQGSSAPMVSLYLDSIEPGILKTRQLDALKELKAYDTAKRKRITIASYVMLFVIDHGDKPASTFFINAIGGKLSLQMKAAIRGLKKNDKLMIGNLKLLGLDNYKLARELKWKVTDSD